MCGVVGSIGVEFVVWTIEEGSKDGICDSMSSTFCVVSIKSSSCEVGVSPQQFKKNKQKWWKMTS